MTDLRPHAPSHQCSVVSPVIMGHLDRCPNRRKDPSPGAEAEADDAGMKSWRRASASRAWGSDPRRCRSGTSRRFAPSIARPHHRRPFTRPTRRPTSAAAGPPRYPRRRRKADTLGSWSVTRPTKLDERGRHSREKADHGPEFYPQRLCEEVGGGWDKFTPARMPRARTGL